MNVIRESPVLEALAHTKPKWGELNGMRVAVEVGSGVDSPDLEIADLSALAKLGLKGSGAAAWLEKHGLKTPSAVYACSISDTDRSLLVRTGSAEFYIEDAPNGETVARLLDNLNFNPPDVYPVWRQDASFALRGKNSIEVLAQTCGYNFRDSKDDFIYSRVAGVSCGILKQINGDTLTFRFWLDNSYGMYLWEQLVQIVHELNGEVVGFNRFYPNAITADSNS